MKKLTRQDVTKAVGRFAKRYGYFAKTVRCSLALQRRAIFEFRTEVLKETDVPQDDNILWTGLEGRVDGKLAAAVSKGPAGWFAAIAQAPTDGPFLTERDAKGHAQFMYDAHVLGMM